MEGSALKPLRIPLGFWRRPDVREALETRDFGQLFQLVHKFVGGSQTQIGIAAGLTQASVSRIMQGARLVTALEVMERTADGFVMPDEARLLLGLAPAHDVVRHPARPTGSLVSTGGTSELNVRRRALLASGLGVATLPAIRLDDLNRIIAALTDARRYFDRPVIEYLRQQLAARAAEDGARGPRATLPAVLGLIAAIDSGIREAKTQVRHELLAVGARGAEFAGWLYRDIGELDLAEYWRDRAMEWAQAGGDSTMQGYILLKKSQAAWDERDAVRMLTLAQAAQSGPWQLPQLVRAEAAQQEARGHAMLGADLDQVERKLDEAREVCTADPSSPASGGYGTGPLLAMQTAICYQEARLPQRAIEIYDRELTEARFSRRDHGYFLSLKSVALASAQAPDRAATTGLQSLAVAAATGSVRTLRELDRVVSMLQPWADRPRVRELREAMLA
jgi:hypothetical protein